MLTREQKQKLVKNLEAELKKAKGIVFVDFSPLKAIEQRFFRKNLKENKASLLVARKTLIQKAFSDLKIPLKIEEIKGPLGLAVSAYDSVAPFRGANEAKRINQNLKILGGIYEGRILTLAEALQLASLPSRQELLTRLVWLVQSPVQRFVQVLNLYSQKKTSMSQKNNL